MGYFITPKHSGSIENFLYPLLALRDFEEDRWVSTEEFKDSLFKLYVKNSIDSEWVLDENGNVGEIGGVTYKLAAAVKAKADLFICPSKNYEDAINYAKEKKYEITIRGVNTFEDALKVLKEEGKGNEIN